MLLGRGAVGGGVYELLCQLEPLMEIVRIAVADAREAPPEDGVSARSAARDRSGGGSAEGADLVIEVLGGVEPPGRAVAVALNPAHVVTANKVLGAAWRPPRALARLRGCLLRYSAAVGGSMPLWNGWPRAGPPCPVDPRRSSTDDELP